MTKTGKNIKCINLFTEDLYHIYIFPNYNHLKTVATIYEHSVISISCRYVRYLQPEIRAAVEG